MSPLTLERIKKAKGNVRIISIPQPGQTVTVTTYAIQILENNAWTTVFTDRNRQLCEQTVSKATGQVLLG